MAKKSSRSDEEWLQLIRECRSSGMTDRVWCEEHQIAFSTFYYHVQDLRKKARDLPEPVRKGRDILQEVVPVAIIEDEISHPVNQAKVTTFHIGGGGHYLKYYGRDKVHYNVRLQLYTWDY